jgi:hypothetical protein
MIHVDASLTGFARGRIHFNVRVDEMQLSRGGSVAGRCQRYLTAAGCNRTLDRQDETSNESRLMRTPASDR